MPQVRREFKVINRRSDSVGNMLIIEQEPLYKNYKIKIALVSEGNRERLIGEVDAENKVLLVRRNREKHFHRISRSYGFNNVVIDEIALFRRVLLMEEIEQDVKYFLIPDKVILTYGKHLYFKEQGFELQLFVPYIIIEKYEFKGRWEKGKLISEPVGLFR